MEATGEDMGLLQTIRPPNLEDAGLEDCALPPHSIQEAFLKAASAVGSRAAAVFTTSDEKDDGCVSDPFSQPQSDALVGVTPDMGRTTGPCTAEKGGPVVGDGGDLVVGERNEEDVEKKDDVVVVGGGGDCVDELRDLKIEERESDGGSGGGDDDGDEKEKLPTLVEGYFCKP